MTDPLLVWIDLFIFLDNWRRELWSIKPNWNHHVQLFAMTPSIRRYWKLRESFIGIMQPIIRPIICSTNSLFAWHRIWREQYLHPCFLLIAQSHPSFRIIFLWSYIVKYSLNENFTILYGTIVSWDYMF